MAYRIRPAQLAALLIAFCIIAAGIIIYLRRSHTPSPGQLAAALPAGPGATVSLDMKALREGGVLRKFVGSKLNQEDEYRQFVDGTGFDYTTDLDHVFGKLTATQNYFVITGRFDWKKMIAYAGQNGGSCRNGFCRIGASQPNRYISFYAVRPTVMALSSGTSDSGAYSIEMPATEPPGSALPAEPLWLSMPGSAVQQLGETPAGARPFLRALETADTIVMSLGPHDSHFRVTLNVTCRDEEAAAILRAQLDGVTKVLRDMIAREKQTPNPADLSGVLASGTFERKNRNVLGFWAVDRTFFEQLGGA